jgi:hypothetical protein
VYSVTAAEPDYTAAVKLQLQLYLLQALLRTCFVTSNVIVPSTYAQHTILMAT